ncbi:MAG: redoxin domain-containing protein [Nitrospirae bacterium]|nr:redoxin domain-containing protein [Nitrospirota bacterium]
MKKRYFILIILFSHLIFATHLCKAEALLQTGIKPPEFSLKDINGRDVSLSQYTGKKAVAVVFWATWSANSPKALRRFEEFYRKYKDKGIQVIGINADNQTISNDDLENIKKVVKELGVTFPVLVDKGLTTFRSYDVIALPSTVVISEGRITYEMPGFPLVGTEDMFDYILSLAGEARAVKVKMGYQPEYKAIAQINLGREFIKEKMFSMAYSAFNKAIGIDPKFILPYVELSKLYVSEGKMSEAEQSLKKALTVEPDNVVVLSELGFLTAKANKYKEAAELLKKALKKAPAYTPALYYLGYVLGKDGKLKEATASFEEAKGLNPKEYRIYYLSAEVYEGRGMLKEASENYRKALELLSGIR